MCGRRQKFFRSTKHPAPRRRIFFVKLSEHLYSFLSLDHYTRRQLDRIVMDLAVTRNTVESIEKSLPGLQERFDLQESRLTRLERKVFALWVIGPLLVGGMTFAKNFQTWLTEH